MQKLPPAPQGIRTLLDPELARLREARPGLRTPDTCVTCEGAKRFRWHPLDDPVGIDDYECWCTEQWKLHVYFLHSGVELAYQRLSWQDVEAEAGAVEKVRDYINGAKAYVNAGAGLVFYGETGTGKTMLSTLLLKNLLARGHDGFFVNFGEMVSLFTAGWHNREERIWFRRRVENAKVLVIDEVGREITNKVLVTDESIKNAKKRKEKGVYKDFATSAVGSTFDLVLRHRVAASLPTIITTNLDMDALTQSYGTNIFSLLGERSFSHRFSGENFRLEKHKDRFRDEIRQGLTRPVVVG